MLLSSYRPISLLPLVSKMVEQAIQLQMMDFMTQTKQLNSNNNAYRPYHNTTTTLLQITDAIYAATYVNTIATVMTIDESSAFECLDHDILDEKLHLYNFSDSAREWFKAYLSYMTQFVSVGSSKSMMKHIKYGSPRGPYLDPYYSLYMSTSYLQYSRTKTTAKTTHTTQRTKTPFPSKLPQMRYHFMFRR